MVAQATQQEQTNKTQILANVLCWMLDLTRWHALSLFFLALLGRARLRKLLWLPPKPAACKWPRQDRCPLAL